jgi:hypothetical protein
VNQGWPFCTKGGVSKQKGGEKKFAANRFFGYKKSASESGLSE